DRTYGPDRLADDLAAVLQATIPAGRPAVLVGHSMGAMAIVAWAGRYPDQVPRFAAAALLASTGLSDLAGAGRVLPLPRHWARVHAVAGRGLLTAALPLGRPGPISHRALRYVTMSPAASPAQVAFCERIVLACPPRARAGWGLALHSLDLWESLPALVVPTAVLVGAADRMTPPALARRLAAALPLADGLVELPGVGHMSTVEAPDAVADEVRRLVRTYAGSAA
ncbi:MAG TPA: alpha/beta hydrolase, partial [Mycobacteriales bacterium]|nr:alpha/beta hydrolase [Mycobacteriales bacterium]